MAKPFLRAHERVIDVGCNLGAFTTAALSAGCVVQAFDADPRVKDRWPFAGELLTITAVGALSGEAPVFGIENTAESSLYRDAVLSEKVAEIGRVPLARLDNLVTRADLIKVDVQGAESDVLTGAPRTLETCPAWIVECWPHGLYKAGSSPLWLWHQFTEAGLTVSWANGEVVQQKDLEEWMQGASKTSHVNWLATR